nr:mesotocin [Iguana iguana]
CYIQNCPLI